MFALQYVVHLKSRVFSDDFDFIWKVGKSRRVSVTNTRPSVIYKLSKQGLSCIPADSDVKVLHVLAMLHFLLFICLNLF